MAKGSKTGGRAKGVPNKKTYDIIQKLEGIGCDPILGMAKIAMNEDNSPDLRGRMFAELCQYVHPKRKSVELTGNADQPLVVRQILESIDGESADLPKDQR